MSWVYKVYFSTTFKFVLIFTFEIYSVLTGICVANACENGGSCLEVDGSPKCHCLDGYIGKNCENGRLRIPYVSNNRIYRKNY